MDFSVIIPVYNCHTYLRGCVDSILSARIPSLEILLIDDGSTDGSSALCDALALENTCIRVIHQENAGVSAARNTGLREAEGDYILFADGDDSLDSREFARVLSDPRCRQADLTLFGVTFDYYHNGIRYRRDPWIYDKEGVLTQQIWETGLPALYLCNALCPVWNKIFRRSVLLDNRIAFPEGMFLYEDLAFILSCLACCRQILSIPRLVYHYRQAEDEGNAGRRLSHIPSIPEFLFPVEEGFRKLRLAHPAIAREDCQWILQNLHLTLAREKIAISPPKVIRSICRDYACWDKTHISAPQASRFRNQLLKEAVFALRFHRFHTNLRHRLAVAVKSHCAQGGC